MASMPVRRKYPRIAPPPKRRARKPRNAAPDDDGDDDAEEENDGNSDAPDDARDDDRKRRANNGDNEGADAKRTATPVAALAENTRGYRRNDDQHGVDGGAGDGGRDDAEQGGDADAEDDAKNPPPDGAYRHEAPCSECGKRARFHHQSVALCGIHSADGRRDGTRRLLPINPRRGEIRAQQRRAHQATVDAAAALNFAAGRRGTVTARRTFRYGRQLPDAPGVLNVFPNFRHAGRTDGLGLPRLSPKSLGPVGDSYTVETAHQSAQVFPIFYDYAQKRPRPEFFVMRAAMQRDPFPYGHQREFVAKNVRLLPDHAGTLEMRVYLNPCLLARKLKRPLRRTSAGKLAAVRLAADRRVNGGRETPGLSKNGKWLGRPRSGKRKTRPLAALRDPASVTLSKNGKRLGRPPKKRRKARAVVETEGGGGGGDGSGGGGSDAQNGGGGGDVDDGVSDKQNVGDDDDGAREERDGPEFKDESVASRGDFGGSGGDFGGDGGCDGDEKRTDVTTVTPTVDGEAIAVAAANEAKRERIKETERIAREMRDPNSPVCAIFTDASGTHHQISRVVQRQLDCSALAALIAQEPQWHRLVELVARGTNVCIVGYDAQPLTRSSDARYLDAGCAFGHEDVIATMLTEPPDTWPWLRHKTLEFDYSRIVLRGGGGGGVVSVPEKAATPDSA